MKKSVLIAISLVIFLSGLIVNTSIINSENENISLDNISTALAQDGETWFEGIFIPNSKQAPVPQYCECSYGVIWVEDDFWPDGGYYYYPIGPGTRTVCRGYGDGCERGECIPTQQYPY